MISLRKHLDSYCERAHQLSHEPVSMTDAALQALRSALTAMGECGQRAVPSLEMGLAQKLADINRGLAPSVTPDALNSVSGQVRAELSQWAERALQHHNENEREIREIIGVVTRATETIGRKDEKYNREIGELTGKMRSIADLRDVAVLRRSIIESANLLKSCVEKMAEDGKSSMSQLTAELAEYRTRLEESERAATLDPLTKLANRRAFDRELERKIAARDIFCLILIDLNGFKNVNDRYGHLAGDDLLRQFAGELALQFFPADTVCRWGGDEFAVIVAGDMKEASARVEGVRKWVLGEYKITNGSQPVRLTAAAAIGVVQWDQKETGLELIARADQGLYLGKDSCRRPAATLLQGSSSGALRV